MSQGTSTSTPQMCVFARGVTFDSAVLEKLADRHLTARQRVRILLCNLEVSKLFDTATDCDPCITGFQSSMCFLSQIYVRLSSVERINTPLNH
jgi:hypothetical protein